MNRAVDSPNNFKILTVTNLIDGVSREGNQYFLNSGIVATGSRARSNAYWNEADHFLIDDMGQSERYANYFGNKIDVVTAFLQRRYYAYTDSFALTHISTNITPIKIEQEYGGAINSRMREMFNIILFPGKDKRK